MSRRNEGMLRAWDALTPAKIATMDGDDCRGFLCWNDPNGAWCEYTKIGPNKWSTGSWYKDDDADADEKPRWVEGEFPDMTTKDWREALRAVHAGEVYEGP